MHQKIVAGVSKVDRTQKKNIAKTIYLADSSLTIKQVADKVAVNQSTLSRWIKEEQWDGLRKSLLTTKNAQLSRLYDILQNLTSEKKPNADQISKITASIERLEIKTSIADIVSVAKDFIQYIAKTDFGKSKEIAILFDAFIQEKLKAHEANG